MDRGKIDKSYRKIIGNSGRVIYLVLALSLLAFTPAENVNTGGPKEKLREEAKENRTLADSAASKNGTAAFAVPMLSNIESTRLNYTENDPPVEITNTMTVSDPDGTIFRADVVIEQNYTAGEDTLIVGNLNGMSASFTESNFGDVLTMTLCCNVTPAEMEATLRSVAYFNKSDDPFTNARSFSFTVTDGTSDSNKLARSMNNLVSVNDAPELLNIESTALNNTENDPATPITSTLTVDDPDNTSLTGATVQITGNYVPMEDLIEFTNTSSITGSFDASTGTMTLSGTASLSAYRDALRSVTYRNTSENPTANTRTVSFTATDGTDTGTAVTRDINVTSVNDPPVLSGIESTTLNYTENDPASAITSSITVSDVDNTNLQSATVQVTSNYVNGEDLLEFTDTPSITGSFDSATGTMTLTGNASLSEYETALRSVTYRNTSDDPSVLTRTVGFTVNDGADDSNTQTRDIGISAVDDPPVLANIETDTLQYVEGDPDLDLTDALTISDVDSDNLTGARIDIRSFENGQDTLIYTGSMPVNITVQNNGSVFFINGVFSINEYQTILRSFSYRNLSDNPVEGFKKIDFTAKSSGNNFTGNTVTRVVEVINDNIAPEINNLETTDLVYTEGDPPVPISNTVTISDVDNDSLTGAIITLKSNKLRKGIDTLFYTGPATISPTMVDNKLFLGGTATIADYQQAIRSVSYQNRADKQNKTALQVKILVRDGETANDESVEVSRTIQLVPVNDPPVLSNIEPDTLQFTEGGGPLTVTDSITVSDLDDNGLQGATIRITGPNYIPGEDVLQFTDTPNITGSFDPASGTLTLTSGSVALNNYRDALRSITYQNTNTDDPAPGLRDIVFQVNDGDSLSNLQTRVVNVQAVNEAPVLANIESTVLNYTENDPATAITSTITVNDVDNANLQGATVQVTSNYVNGEDLLEFTDTPSITGSFDSATGTMTLTGSAPLADYQNALRSVTYRNSSMDPATLTRTVSFTVSDTALDSNTLTRDINVQKVNDKTTVSGIEPSDLLFTEGDPPTQITASITVSDADNSTVQSAAVEISSNYTNGEDLLGFTDMLGITGSFDADAGRLTLTGPAALSDFETALRSVTYDNSSDDPSTLTRTVSFSVDDGTGPGPAASRDIQVQAVNDPPVLADIESTALVYVENDPATAITSSITVSDSDNANLASATVQITSNYVNGEDLLEFTDTPSITGSFDASTGTMTLNGSAPLADYQTALRSVAYRNSSMDPSTATRTVSFTVNDGTTDSNTQTRDISLQATNDAPVLADIETTAINYTENDPATPVTSSITVSDPDNANLASATVQITGNYANGEDLLEFTDTPSITGSFDSATGTMTLTGSAPLADYQNALRSVAYRNASMDPSTATRTVSFTVNDGTDPSNTLSRDINVQQVNDKTTVSGIEPGDLLFTEGDPPTQITASITVSDSDNSTAQSAAVEILNNYANGEDLLGFTDMLGITGSFDAAAGRLTLTGPATLSDFENALRSVTYENSSDDPSTLTRTVRFTVDDGTGPGAPVTRDIQVQAVNDAPLLANIEPTALNYGENDPATPVSSSITVSDPDNSTLTGGTVQITNNYVNGEDLLEFADTPSITGSFDVSTGTLTLAGNASLSDYESALRAVTYRNSSSNPSTATRTVSFTVNDGTTDSNTETRDITLQAANNPPVLADIESAALDYTENDPATAITSSITVSDVDNANLASATVQITANYANGEDLLEFSDTPSITGSFDSVTGTMTLTGPATLAEFESALRSVAYRNSSDDPSSATRTVEFTVNDGTDPSNIQSRDINVQAVNDPPVLADIETTVLNYVENDPATAITSSITVSDADNANLASATVQVTGNYVNGEDLLEFTDTPSITGSFDSASGTMTLTGSAPLADYQNALRSVAYRNTSMDPSTATRTVSFTVNDGSDDSNIQTRDISIQSVNDNSMVGGIELNDLIYTEGDPPTVITSTITVSDSDNSTAQSASVEISNNYANGEDLLGFTDMLGITGSFDVASGRLTLTGPASLSDFETALRSVTYENSSDDPSTLARTVSFSVNDGTGPGPAASRDIQVQAVNDPPILAGIESTALNYTENDPATPVTGTITVNDVDNANLTGATVRITANYVNGEDLLEFPGTPSITGSFDATTGTMTLTGTAPVSEYESALRTVSYRNPSMDPSTVTRTVSYTVSDGTADSNVETRDISVQAVNDKGTVGGIETDDLIYTEGDPPTVITSAITVSDADDSSLQSALVSISGNYAGGEDLLAFVDTLGITGSFDASTGRLTLTGPAGAADFQAALRTVTYENSSFDPATLTRTVSFAVDDGTGLGPSVNRDIQVQAVNNASMLGGIETDDLIYTEGDPPTVVTQSITVTDADDGSAQSAVVDVSGNYVDSEDLLAFTDTLGITGSFDSTTGRLTLTGPASLADFQAALRSVTYENRSSDPSTMKRTVSFTVDDGTGPGNTVSRNIQVRAVNNASTISGIESDTLLYIENDPPVIISKSIQLVDPDTDSLVGASVQITTNYAGGEDILEFTNTPGITGTFDPATGTMSLSGKAPLSDYLNALRSVTYRNGSEAPSEAPRTVELKVDDGTSMSNAESRPLNVQAVNDPPVLANIETTAINYTEKDPAVPVTSSLTVDDVDHSTLPGATVQITGNYVNGEDLLAFTDTPSITGSFDAATGTMTLTGTASVADYQAALQSVAYRNTSNTPSTVTRTVSFTASDGISNSNTETRNITITAVNDAPVLSGAGTDTLSYRENDPPLLITPSLTLSDPNNDSLVAATIEIAGGFVGGQDELVFADTLNITGSFDPAAGLLSLDGKSRVEDYQAALQSVGYRNTSDDPDVRLRSIRLTVIDGTDSTSVNRVLRVIPVNDAPVLSNIEQSRLQYREMDPPLTISSALTLVDVDDDSVSEATVSISNNLSSTQDVLEFTQTASISGNYNSSTGILTLSGVAPISTYQSVLRSVAYRNDSDNPSPLIRTISFRVGDGSDQGNVQSREIEVIPVNDAPGISGIEQDTLQYVEDSSPVPISGSLVISDPDGIVSGAFAQITSGYSRGSDRLVLTDSLGLEVQFNEDSGTLKISGSAPVEFYQTAVRGISFQNISNNPELQFRTIELQVDDGTDSSSTVSRTVEVIPVNDAPVISNVETDTLIINSFLEDRAVVSNAIIISDADNDSLEGAEIKISSDFDPDLEKLSYNGESIITGSWDETEGNLTFTGKAPVAAYTEILQNIIYQVNVKNDMGEGIRPIDFQVDDGTDRSELVTRVLRFTTLTHFRLYNNYPNPFNPTTTIEYDLPLRSSVVLEIYDILGRKIATLVDEVQNVGTYRVDFGINRFNLASGVYLYRIGANSTGENPVRFTDTKKMVLIK